MVLINLCFAIGVFLGGTILVPPLSIRHPDFNLVSLLTYLAEALHGGGWVALQIAHGTAVSNPDGLFHLHRMAAKSFADLGTFHLVVAGCLNYFSTTRLYDLLTGQAPAPAEKKGVEGDGKASPANGGAPV